MPAPTIGLPGPEPKRLSDIPRVVSRVLTEGEGAVNDLVERLGTPTDSASSLETEREIQQLFAQLGDLVFAAMITVSMRSKLVRARARATAREDRRGAGLPLKDHGKRGVLLRLLGGAIVAVATTYFAPDHSKKPGPRRTSRGKSGGGCYPVLDQLGFVERMSPALASEVGRTTCGLSSFEEAQRELAGRGVDLNLKTVRAVSQILGDRALRCRDQRLADFEAGTLESTGEFAGKRVAIMLDGGRTRTRVSGKRGRRRKKTNRRGYKTPWREPKLFTICEIDDKGKKTKAPPIYEGTFANWNRTFDYAIAECKRRGVDQATEIVIIGDGSRSIWDRVDKLITALEFPSNRVTKVADFYHAAEKVYEIAAMPSRWSKKLRRAWAAKALKLLRAGRIEDLIVEGKKLAVGRRGKKVNKALAYFEKRKALMRYADFRKRGIPRGSGMVESAIRRIINLRLKGPGIFWEVENAERMLILRANLKAGRWQELERDVFSPTGFARRRLQPRPALKDAA